MAFAGLPYFCPHIENSDAEIDLNTIGQPPRVHWRDFPDAVLLATEQQTRQHPDYAVAKAGNGSAAGRLVHTLVDDSGLTAVRTLLDQVKESRPLLVSAHAYEREGFNAIPGALARLISKRLEIPFDSNIVQTNIVGHTGADGYSRLARQAAFDGEVAEGRKCVMVDDFIGQGGTLANLRGWIESNGGKAIGAVALTGKPYSAKLNPTGEQLHELRQKHDQNLEEWWRERFGHAFDCLTQSEARYLARSPDADAIRGRLVAAMRHGGDGSRP
ncbi:MAG: phosphoribosyltransferase [Halieaceae bacterium]|nr:phosphoribosyltransferase [Halieaceae bacterium]